MPHYEVYVEETHYFKEIIEADSSEKAQEMFYNWQLTDDVYPYDVDTHYAHAIPVEVADNA